MFLCTTCYMLVLAVIDCIPVLAVVDCMLLLPVIDCMLVLDCMLEVSVGPGYAKVFNSNMHYIHKPKLLYK